MKLTVLSWLKDALIIWIARLIEFTFRSLLLLLPLGVYLVLIQFRSKASAVSSLSTFTSDKSAWQHIFPGFILVTIDQGLLKTVLLSNYDKFQSWLKGNKYTLALLFMIAIVCLMILN